MKILSRACSVILLIWASGVYAQQEPEVLVEPVVFSEQELDQMLAPVALYPDTVLAHILIAATYPLEVVQAARWTERNPTLSGEEALQAVEDEDWDPSVQALVAFPDLLKRMSENLDWTQRLGDAFLDDEARITASIQKLRQRAYDEGNLQDAEHLEVVKEEDVIVIEPAVREVVYVPYYDTRYVYGSWWWDRYPPVYWHHPHHHFHNHYYTGFYWGPRVRLSVGFFFSGFHWHNRHLVVLDRHHRYSRRYYSSREVVYHRDSHRWRHNPRHRRGVDYRNPRTRDSYQRRDRRQTNVSSRTGLSREVRSSSRRDPQVVRQRLRDDRRSSRSPTVDTGNRQRREVQQDNRRQRAERKSERSNRGNIKLGDRSADTNNVEGMQQRQTRRQRVEVDPGRQQSSSSRRVTQPGVSQSQQRQSSQPRASQSRQQQPRSINSRNQRPQAASRERTRDRSSRATSRASRDDRQGSSRNNRSSSRRER